MSEISYLGFLFLFMVVPVLLLFLGAMYRKGAVWWDREAFFLVSAVLALALVYTTPWDNFMILNDVWEYSGKAVFMYVWNAPLGEYFFFIFQTFMTSIWVFHLIGLDDYGEYTSGKNVLKGVSVGIVVGLIGLMALTVEKGFYSGSILLWSTPVLAVQWGFGWKMLWRLRKIVAAGILIPTVYLCIVDSIAISSGIWSISEVYATGLKIGLLPIEEALFFLMTNTFIVQGLLLYRYTAIDWKPFQNFSLRRYK